MKRILYFPFLLAMLTSQSYAQVKIGDNPTTVNPNSILELESTTKGLLLPRISNEQMQAMQNVPAGMLVYSSTDNVLYIRTNSAWVTLAQAANAASATNPWSSSGVVAYTTSSRVGIGTSTPSSQLANTSGNTVGTDGFGGSSNSFAWVATQQVYATQIYNEQPGYGGNGLAVKVASPGGTALDVSIGAQDAKGTSLLFVNSNGRVGANTNSPSETLDVRGNITTTGMIQASSDVTSGGTISAAGFTTSGSISANAGFTTSGSVSATTFNLGVQYVVNVSTVSGASTAFNVAVARRYLECPTGTKLIGGGGGHTDSNGAQSDIVVDYSGPNPDNLNEWRLLFYNKSTEARSVTIYAICAKVQ